MLKFDTIVAPVSSITNSPISIVRISGPASYQLAYKITGKKLHPRLATYCSFKENAKNKFDNGIAIYFKSPNSFTGEDVVEFQCHGSIAVVNLLIETCLSYSNSKFSVRLAEPGEFSKRAYLNERIDLTEAESIAMLINSNSEGIIRAINNSLTGDFGNLVKNLSSELLKIRANLEARLDFVEDNLGEIEINNIAKSIDKVITSVNKCINLSSNAKQLVDIGKVVIIGPTNVGKSSLLNWFSQQKASIVSDSEGTTRDVIKEIVNIEKSNIRLRIADTAGIRVSHDLVENEGIKRTWKEIDNSDCILVVFDCSSKHIDEDLKLLKKIAGRKGISSKSLFVVFNKIDTVEIKEFRKNIKDLDQKIFFTSVKTEFGMKDLKKQMENVFTNKGLVNFSNCLIISHRNMKNLEVIYNQLRRAVINIHQKKFDLCAEDLKGAHEVIKVTIGEYLPEDLLDKIFSTFCIGK
ncbi:MAG: tRNA uridine-5-carboxymethylaminomethyl(34) synthesis GTPase MnmE [Betaproteobacteria bacterium TMED156]|nr:MAG: tRNA uridine-5-carboxymethylaminomethyl(34) synthesis GTPase MnmE [Betaproteobacteria bacterium TMED156]